MAGSSLSGPHPTIANLDVILTDTASNSSLILLCSITGILDTTADTYQKGCIIYATDVAAGTSGVYQNTGSSASPVWGLINSAGGAAGSLSYVEDNANGANNAVAASLFSSGTTKVALVTGMIVALKLKHTLQVGANTFNLNGTTKSIFQNSNLLNLNTTFAVGSVLMLAYTPGVTTSGCLQYLGTSK